MKWLAGYIFWGFIILVFSLFIIGVIVGIIAANRIEDPEERKHTTQIAYIGAAVTVSVVIIFALVIFCFRTKIRYGIELVKEGSRAVTCSTSSIFLPIIPFIVRAFFIILTIFFCFAVATNYSYIYTVKGIGNSSFETCECNYSNGDECTPEQFNKDCSSDSSICLEASCSVEFITYPGTAYFYWVIA